MDATLFFVRDAYRARCLRPWYIIWVSVEHLFEFFEGIICNVSPLKSLKTKIYYPGGAFIFYFESIRGNDSLCDRYCFPHIELTWAGRSHSLIFFFFFVVNLASLQSCTQQIDLLSPQHTDNRRSVNSPSSLRTKLNMHTMKDCCWLFPAEKTAGWNR